MGAEKGDEQLVTSRRADPRPHGLRLRVLGKGAVVHTRLPGLRSLLRQQVRSEKDQEIVVAVLLGVALRV